MRKLIIVLIGIFAIFVFIQNSIIADTDDTILSNDTSGISTNINIVHTAIMQ
ncbi:MAG TPA: hypothetical protein P5519_04065 [Spirochaetia bacterium]|nr:hypothetical protein [Spirochaetales bacterium]HRS65046.1 hypothetical protein [Spirochaetia bacterium]HOT59852.1 hypothetical protein [Spirochaetales bacterium]HPD79554.1 hypothetical protein [Spirochaetales bacterium]HQG40666.1 hypothetical protein [Spirochaetales bacterium]